MNDDIISPLIRPDLRGAVAYQAAAPDFSRLRLHANESPWPGDAANADSAAGQRGLNRYPPVRDLALEAALARYYGVSPDRLFATRGSDDGIDMLLRAFCRARIDNIIVQPPCFGMYAAFARVQGAAVREVPLRADEDFALVPARVIDACDDDTRLVFLISPNNPTGNLQSADALLKVVHALRGRAMVVIDEAYIEFADAESLAGQLSEHDNLIVLRTLSKAAGLAGVRCGAVLAHRTVIDVLSAIAPPYAIPVPVSEQVRAALGDNATRFAARVRDLRHERDRLARRLEDLPPVRRVWPSAANFLLVDVDDADKITARCRQHAVLIRRFSGDPALARAVRITVGSAQQNARLLDALAAVPA